MADQELARLLDPGALDAAGGPRARHAITVPRAWLGAGCELHVTVPRRLACARCEGGGCDGCARSGALEAPGEEGARTVRVTVPAGSGDGVALRLVQPFGPEDALDQLLLELRPGEGEDAARGVTRLELVLPSPVALAPRFLRTQRGALLTAVALVAAVLGAWLASHR